MLTQAILKENLHYDPVTGVFSWTDTGRPAGRKACGGRYIEISLFGELHKAHRLAFFYQTGKWPEQKIDHKDTDSLNNAWSNLREASQGQNCHNRSKASNNTSGVKVVHFNAKTGKWLARVTHNGVRFYLGLFLHLEDAKKAVEEKRKGLHGDFSNDG